MAASIGDRTQLGWRFWFIWMGASIAATVAYMLTIPLIIGIINALAPMLQAENITPEQRWIGVAITLLGSAALGAVIGLAQWLVLRRYLSRLGWWVLATMIGYVLLLTLGPSIPVREPPWLAGSIMFLMAGAALGILQWLVLRGRVYHAGWWVAISIGGWVLAFALTGIAYLSGLYVEPFDLVSAFLVPVGVAGAGIVWLLRQSAPVAQALN